MITWNKTMSTGVPRLDEQHKMLFQKFNEFSAVISKVTAREAAGDILDFLQFYVLWHFKEEEAYMDECQSPAAEENKRAHAEFISRFGQFYTQWQENTMTPQLANDTYLELQNWLVNHIALTDTRLNSHVKK